MIHDLGGPSSLKEFESEENIYALLEKEQNYFGRFYFSLYKGFSSYLLGDAKGAYEHLANAKNYLSAVPGSVVLADYYIYLPLIALELIDLSNPEEDLQNSIEESITILEKWNSSIPDNFQFRIDLIKAIKKDKEGHVLEALELYDAAIDQATKQEMLPLKAIALEKAGIIDAKSWEKQNWRSLPEGRLFDLSRIWSNQ